MGTTAAVIDNIPNADLNLDDERGREMSALLSRYSSSFYRHAYRHLGNVADAEDAVQDALLSAYKHMDQFRGGAQMSTWLTAIVINSARMQLRRRPRQVHISLDEHPDSKGLALSELLPDHKPSPEEQCRKSDLAENVVQIMSQLSPVLRRAFQLRYLDGLTIREMTGILGVAEGTAKARIARARAKLRSLMHRRLDARRRHRSIPSA